MIAEILEGATHYLLGFCVATGTWFAFYTLAAMR